MIILIWFLLNVAFAGPCGFDLDPRPWSTLPPVEAHALPGRFTDRLAEHPVFRTGRLRYGRGEALTFDFSVTNRDRTNGWVSRRIF